MIETVQNTHLVTSKTLSLALSSNTYPQIHFSYFSISQLLPINQIAPKSQLLTGSSHFLNFCLFSVYLLMRQLIVVRTIRSWVRYPHRIESLELETRLITHSVVFTNDCNENRDQHPSQNLPNMYLRFNFYNFQCFFPTVLALRFALLSFQSFPKKKSSKTILSYQAINPVKLKIVDCLPLVSIKTYNRFAHDFQRVSLLHKVKDLINRQRSPNEPS